MIVKYDLYIFQRNYVYFIRVKVKASMKNTFLPIIFELIIVEI